MAIKVGSRREQVLRGMDRFVATVADAAPGIPILPRRQAKAPSRWLIERGTTRVQAPVDVLGGFLGSLRSMNRLDNVQMLVTMRYLVVGEGTPHGFAIPMRDLIAASAERPGRRSNTGLRVWYRDGDRTGSFFLAFRGVSRGISGLTRAEQVMQFLVERGVAPIDAADVPPIISPFLPWTEARRFAGEDIVWAGNGFASVGGWFGSVQDHCRIWITGQSLLWAAANENGVNRIALADILEARDGAGDRVCVGIRDGMGYRFDLAFDLASLQFELEREANPRVQFMNTLASRGVPVATAPPTLAPWRAGRMVRPAERMPSTSPRASLVS